MRIHLLTNVLALTAVLSPLAFSQRVAVFRGQGAGDVELLDPTKSQPTLRPSALQGIRILPIDFVGRTQIDELRADRPRLREDLPGASRSRIVLPGGHGALYRFSRSEGAGGTVFGFFRVTPAGVAESVFERPGWGAGQLLDPFVARIAVAPAGDSFLAATVPGAGGDLFEVYLAFSPAQNRTSAVAPLNFSDAGLALSDSLGVGVGANGVWRFRRDVYGDASSVDYASAPPTHWSGELALSENGQFAVTTAGTAPDSLHVWTFGSSGPAVRVTDQPGKLSGAGYLPESLHGPYLAVSDDGSQCAWRREATVQENTREAYLAFVQPPQGATPTKVSDDPFYVDTLDEVGQFFFRAAFGLILAVGSRDAASGEIEGLDVYSVRLAPSDGSPSFTNITLSSGDPDTPFEASELKPENSVLVPAAGALLFADNESETLMAMIEGQGGTKILLGDVKELTEVELVGDRLLLHLRRESGNKPRQLHSLAANLNGGTQLLFSSDEADEVRRGASLDGRWYAFVEEFLGSEFVYRCDLANNNVRIMTPRSFLYGRSMAYSSNEHLVASLGPPGGNAFVLGWHVDGFPQRLKPATLPAFVLPAD